MEISQNFAAFSEYMNFTSQKYGGDFAKFCDLLRIYERYKLPFFWYDLFLEARAEMLEKFSLVFWKIWRHQNDTLELTDLYFVAMVLFNISTCCVSHHPFSPLENTGVFFCFDAELSISVLCLLSHSQSTNFRLLGSFFSCKLAFLAPNNLEASYLA